MTIIFLIFLIAIVAVLQYLTISRGIERLTVDFWPDEKLAEPEEQFNIVLSFLNRGRFFIPFIRYRQRLSEDVTVHLDPKHIHSDGRGEQTVSGTTWLSPRQRVEKRIPVSIEKRGRYLLKDVSVYGGDFLGMSEQIFTFSGLKEIVIYPKAISGRQLDKVFGGFLGELSVNRFLYEDPVLTLGYREYTGREPMKMISWTQSARTGELMVKKFDYTLEPAVSVVLNIECGEEDRTDLTETCFRLARTVCDKLEDEGIKYDFLMNAITVGSISDGSYVSEGLGRGHYMGILENLGRATSTVRRTSEELMERAVHSASSSHGIIFITPGDTPGPEQTARRLAERAGVTVLILKAKEAMEC